MVVECRDYTYLCCVVILHHDRCSTGADMPEYHRNNNPLQQYRTSRVTECVGRNHSASRTVPHGMGRTSTRNSQGDATE